MLYIDENRYLKGKILVATPTITEGCFAKSVIYLVAHDAEGAMGFIINRPITNVSMDDVFEQLEMNPIVSFDDVPVLLGGPVNTNRGFVVYLKDPDSPQRKGDLYFHPEADDNGTIVINADASMLRDIANGNSPNHYYMVLGYAGWKAGQLEAEIEANSWISVNSTTQVVFHPNHEEEWGLAAQQLGIDMSRFSMTAGHA